MFISLDARRLRASVWHPRFLFLSSLSLFSRALEASTGPCLALRISFLFFCFSFVSRASSPEVPEGCHLGRATQRPRKPRHTTGGKKKKRQGAWLAVGPTDIQKTTAAAAAAAAAQLQRTFVSLSALRLCCQSRALFFLSTFHFLSRNLERQSRGLSSRQQRRLRLLARLLLQQQEREREREREKKNNAVE